MCMRVVCLCVVAQLKDMLAVHQVDKAISALHRRTGFMSVPEP